MSSTVFIAVIFAAVLHSVWNGMVKKQDDKYFFKCDSDALIVKGLLSLLCKIYSGHKSKDIQAVSHADILNKVGLSGLISVQRTNGFASAVSKIHEMSI